MAYIIKVTATVAYTDNSVGYVAIIIDEFGNIITNDSSNHPVDISNIKTYTNSFADFPIPDLFNFLNLNILNGTKEINSIVMGVLIVDNTNHCYIEYNNGIWDIYGDLGIALDLFEENGNSISDSLQSGNLDTMLWQLVINNDITATLTPDEQKDFAYTDPGDDFPVLIRVTNNLDFQINIESVEAAGDSDDDYTLIGGDVQAINPGNSGNIEFELANEAGSQYGEFVVTINGTPFTIKFSVIVSDSGGGR